MTIYQVLTMLFYAGLALVALAATWKVREKRWLGVGLLGAWAASNAIWLMFAVEYRPILFSMIDLVFGLIAAQAWFATQSRIPLALIALSIAAAAMSVAFSLTADHTLHQVNTYELVLNLIFATQCIITAAWGFINGAASRDRRFGIGDGPARSPPQRPSSAREEKG